MSGHHRRSGEERSPGRSPWPAPSAELTLPSRPSGVPPVDARLVAQPVGHRLYRNASRPPEGDAPGPPPVYVLLDAVAARLQYEKQVTSARTPVGEIWSWAAECARTLRI